MAATHLHISPNPKTPTPSPQNPPPPWFSPDTGIYTSKHPSVHLPVDPHLDAASALFSHIHTIDDPNSAAFVDSLTGFSISYTELQTMVESIAAAIHRDLGVRQGDVVSLVLPNSLYFPLLFLSLISLGTVVTTMNPSSSLGEIKKQVSECNVALAFTSRESVAKLASLGVVVIRVPESYDLDSVRVENPKFYSIIRGGFDFGSVTKPLVKQDDVAAIMYSSGTTGASKGVMLTHRNLIASMELFVRFEASQYEYPGSSNVYLAALPLCHIYGLSLFVMGLLSVGSTIVVMRRFDVSDVVDVIERFKITHFPVVPPMLMALTKKAKGVCGEAFRSLKQVSSGAAPLSRKFIEDFVGTLPHVDLIQGYGMTESTAVGTRGFNTQKLRKYSSVGLLAPNMQARVVDWSSGSFLPPGNRGELWIQGPGVMKGYLNNPEATEMTIVEKSWLRTGDIAYFDEDGYLFIVDRMKEIIKYKGFQIAPADLEAVLVSHPLIIDAAVTAAPNEECGEIPVAFVVRRQETTLSEQDVINYVAAQVAPYRKVRKVVMVSSIPKSPTGKILRKELKRILTNYCEGQRMQKLGDFKLPQFFNYPPYFTLQPVRDTREKQIQLWKELILDFCKSQKVFLIGVEEDFPLFSNSAIDRMFPIPAPFPLEIT
uniref:4-coumarate--CoA ligase n=1 Tax=Brassica oleracea var. oleracea TaxID=109376 RepID=A0A0D3A496_BRAOL